MANNVDKILQRISERFPSFKVDYHHCIENCNEAVLFGSYAYGCEHKESDIDILFIGDKKRKSSKYYDFIWVKPTRLKSKTWLCSELAIHIAKYGIWLKGTDNWRNHVFYDRSAISRKKQRIYERLIHIYLQKDKLSFAKKNIFIQKIILNTLRLKNLENNIPNPPTCVTINNQKDPSIFFQEMFEPHLLGSVGRAFFEEIFHTSNFQHFLHESFNDLKVKYNRQ